MRISPHALLASLLTFIGACDQQAPQPNNIAGTLADSLQESQPLQTGDIIFARNETLWGKLVRELSGRDKRFSHVGVLIARPAAFGVLHASGSPTDPDGEVRIDSLKDFLSNATGLGIYRADLTTSQRAEITSHATRMGNARLGFNSSLQMGQSDKLYCTELVWKLYQDAVDIDLVPVISTVSGLPVITIADLTSSPFLKEVLVLVPNVN